MSPYETYLPDFNSLMPGACLHALSTMVLFCSFLLHTGGSLVLSPQGVNQKAFLTSPLFLVFDFQEKKYKLS